MKRIFTLCVLVGLMSFAGKVAGQVPSPANSSFEANGAAVPAGSVQNWNMDVTAADGSGATTTTNARTGSYSYKYTTSTTFRNQSNYTGISASYVTVPLNNYVHIISWITGSNNSSLFKLGFYGSSDGAVYSNNINATTTYTQYSGTFPNTTTGQTYEALFNANSSASLNNTTLYFDDFVLYTDASSSIDVTTPGAASSFTNGMISSSSIGFSWTNGTDAATGVQGRIILRTNNTTTATSGPVLNNQGLYSSVGGTSGPNTITDASGVVWTIVSNASGASNGSAGSYTDNTVASGTSYKYAIIDYDLAYNYSTALVSNTITTISTFCTAPTNQPTGLILGSPAYTTTSGSFTANTASGYLIIRSTGTVPSQPINGTTYSSSNVSSLGSGLTFIQSGTGTMFTDAGLTGNTAYTYYVYSYNNTSCTGGPAYSTTTPLSGSVTTIPAAPTATAASSITVSSFNANWTAPAGGASGYYLDVSANFSFSSFVSGYSNLNVGNVTTYAVTGLTANTTYYYRLRAYNITGNSINSNTISTATACPTFASTISIGGTTTTSGSVYPTLTAAIAALQTCGITQPTTLALNSGYDYTAEIYPIALTAITGMSSTNTITIAEASGVTGKSIISTLTSNTTATFNINGGKYWTIDGRSGGSGAADLTISNTNTTGGAAIQFINDAQNNLVEYITLKGLYASSSSGVVLFSTTTGTLSTSGNNNNTITSCNIDGGAGTTASPTTVALAGINSAGTSSYPNSSNTISNNNIFNNFGAAASSFGITLSNSSAFIITGNRFYQTSARTAATGNTNYGIYISTSGGGYTISNNVIGYNTSLGTGTMTIGGSTTNAYAGIYANVSPSVASSVQGNIISGISLTTNASNSTVFAGVFIAGGLVNIGNTTGNIIGASSGTGSIIINNTTTSFNAYSFNSVYGIYEKSSGSVIVNNNVVSSVTATGTYCDYSLYGIYTDGTGSFTVDSNNVGSSTTNAVSIGSGSSSYNYLYGIYNNSTGTINIGASGSPNTIRNLLCNTGSSDGEIYGITNANSASSVSINYNVITGNTSSGTGGYFLGIYNFGSVTNTLNITNNTIDLGTYTASSNLSIISGVYITAAPSGCALTISTNTFQNLLFSGSTGGSGTVYGIYNDGGITPASSVISSNNFNNLSIKTTGYVYLISNSYTCPSGGTKTIQNNYITTACARTGTATTNDFVCYNDFGFSKSNRLHIISGNNFSNITTNISGTGGFYGIFSEDYYSTSYNPGLTAYNNTVSNIAAGGATTIYSVYLDGFAGTSGTPNAVYGNTVSNITAKGTPTIYGLYLGVDALYVNAYSNTISGITSSGATTFYGIYTDAGSVNYILTSNNIGSSNANDISIGSSSASSLAYGIYSLNTGLQTISNNTVNNLTVTTNSTATTLYGIYASGSTSSSSLINLNTISNLSTTANSASNIFSVIGLYSSPSAANQSVRQNTVNAIRNTYASFAGCVGGIYVNSTIASGADSVIRNKVYDLTAAGTNSPFLYGIHVFQGNWTTANNMVSIVNGNNTNAVTIYGIASGTSATSTYTDNFYYNSVYVAKGSGTISGSANSSAFYRSTSAKIFSQDNLFVNLRTGGTGTHFAEYNAYTTNSNYTTDYNALKTTDSTKSGYWAPTSSSLSFSNWKAATGASHDVFVSDALVFTDAANGDLHIAPSSCGGAAINNAGTYIPAVLIDYDNETRSTTTPDIGADEFTGTVTLPTAVLSGSQTSCSGSAATLSVSLTGNAPWSFVYSDGTANTTVNPVASSPYSLSVSPTVATTYKLISVTDAAGCMGGTVSGTAIITISTSPVWTGNTSTDWNVAANWCNGTVPTATTTVVIPSSGVTNYPVISNANAVAASVTISSGASLTMSGGYNLTLSTGGTFTNNGTFTATSGTGAVIFNGTGTIAGTVSFNNVTVKGAVDFGSAGTSTITGNLIFSAGGSAGGVGTHVINYSGNSTLTFDPGAGNTFSTTTKEWSVGNASTITSGLGVPQNVIINSGTLILNTGGPYTDRTLAGNLTIAGGSIFQLASGSNPDVYILGNWVNNGGTFTANGHTVTFNGSSKQTITGNTTFYNLTEDQTGSSSLVFAAPNIKIGGNLTITKGTMTPNVNTQVEFTGTGNLAGGVNKTFYDLLVDNTSSMSVSSGGVSIAHNFVNNGTYSAATSYLTTFNGSGVTQTFSAGTGASTTFGNLTIGNTLIGSGATTLNATGDFIITGGLMSFNTNSVYNGSNNTATFSATPATISGTGTANFYNAAANVALTPGTISAFNNNLTLNVGGSIATNAPKYASAATLIYNTTAAGVTTGLEWNAAGTTPGAGIPFNVTIQNTNNVLLAGDRGIGGTLNILSGDALSLNDHTLTLNGAFSGAGKFIGSVNSGLVIGGAAGTVSFTNNTSPATRYNYLKTLTLSSAASNITLGDTLNIASGTFTSPGTVTIATAGGNLNAGNKLILKSSSLGDARIAVSAGTISDSVVVERFIPARRAWRFITAPVNTSQTINKAWQEGSPANTDIYTHINPHPGFGTEITYMPDNALGFDINTTTTPSIKYWDSSVSAWVPPISTYTALNSHSAWCLFVRGSRAVDLSLARSAPPDTTVLRAKGVLNETNGAPVVTNYTAVAGSYLFIGNPYASPISILSALSHTSGINQTKFYVWDPEVSGNYGVGAYVSYSGSLSVPNGSTYSGSTYAQSGQGFFVQATSSGTVTTRFQQGDKSNTESSVNKVMTAPPAAFYTNLMTPSGDSLVLIDGVAAAFGNGYSAAVDAMDANKRWNFEENIALARDTSRLAIEFRPVPVLTDTLFFKLFLRQNQPYALKIFAQNIPAGFPQAWLVDRYLNTKTAFNTGDTLLYNFTPNTDTSSYRSRFILVFRRTLTATPVSSTFSSVAAEAKNIESGLSVYPNPATAGSKVLLKFSNMKKDVYEVTVNSIDGKALSKQTIDHQGGSYNYELQLDARWTTGNYIIKTTGSSGYVGSVKLVVGK